MLLCTIHWIGCLTSLLVALVFVVKTEANALTQHNTYGFARAEVVGAVIVATFLAGMVSLRRLCPLSDELICSQDLRTKKQRKSMHIIR